MKLCNRKLAPVPATDDNLMSAFRYRGIQVFLFYQGSEYLKYECYQDGALVFSGRDFRPSPFIEIDSLGAVTSLLGFLLLKEGDTDAEYFKDYGDAQWAFTRSEDAAALREVVNDYEDSEEPEYKRRARRILRYGFTPY